LNQFGRQRVLHRDQSGGADQVGLLDTVGSHFCRVVGVTEKVEDKLVVGRLLRQYPAHRQAVLDLCNYSLWEDRLNLVV
jgi:hypothetical protein